MPKSRLRKWIVRILIFLLSLVALFFLVVIPVFITHVMTHAHSRPGDAKITTTPQDLGVAYRDITFLATSGPGDSLVTISGWYLPRENPKGIIIYAHGLFRSRNETLKRAVNLWHGGYAAVIFDFRRHGKSGDAKTGMGYLERFDVLGAVAFARDSLQLHVPIVTYGVSMGAAATILANAETDDVDAMIIDSSFLSFDHTIDHHLKLWLGWPRFPIGTLVAALAKFRIGFRADDFDMRLALDKMTPRPTMFIAGEKDNRMPPAVAKELYSHCRDPLKKFLLVPDAGHGHAYDVAPNLFVSEIIAFLDQALTEKNNK